MRPTERTSLADHLSATDLQLLRRRARDLSRGAMDPDDLLQDALERACRAFDRFDPSTSLQAWLRTIMQRLVIDNWRKQAVRHPVSTDGLVAPEPPEPEPLWTRYTLDEVRRASVGLPEPLRTTFRLRLVDGLCYTAISRRLGVPVSTVATRLRRSRLRLRRLLEAATSDKSCDQWSLRRSTAALPPPIGPQPTNTNGSFPKPSPVAIGGRC